MFESHILIFYISIVLNILNLNYLLLNHIKLFYILKYESFYYTYKNIFIWNGY